MKIKSKFSNQDWFQPAADYLLSRFSAVESRLETTFRYVELSSDNRNVFSYEFCSILRDSGSIFSSIIDALINGSSTTQNNKYSFSHYRVFLLDVVPDIYKTTVCMRPCFPSGIIIPFEELKTNKGVPKWWSAYNKVKHHEYKEFRLGNLENCVTAISGLALLGSLMGVFQSDALFVNVGMGYTSSTTEYINSLRLFPKQEKP